MLNTLAPGFLEQVHESAFAHELRQAGLAIARLKGITVYYSYSPVGDHIFYLVVHGTFVVELKASKALAPARTAQCMNCLKATCLHPCLRLNFAPPHLQILRVSHEL